MMPGAAHVTSIMLFTRLEIYGKAFSYPVVMNLRVPSGELAMARESIWVVVPTLDEKQNAAILIPHLLKVNPEWHIVVVDDGSTDGTQRFLRRICEKEERVEAIYRDRTGLGSAIREGMAHAYRRGASRVVTMDADLSHDPDAVPSLLAVEADLVLGSRYVKGGSVVGWPKRRKAISFIANRLSRFSLGTNEKDITTGFRAYRRRMVKLILQRSIADSYNFQVEAIHLAKRHRMTVREVPIVFRERLWGESKLSGPREAAHLMRMLATRSPLRLFMFVALIGAVVNEIFLISLVGFFHLHYLIAGIVAVEAGILASFLLNEKWTFRGRVLKGWPLRLMRYNAFVFGGLLVNLLVLFVLTEFGNLLYLLSNIFAMGTAVSWNYWLMGLLTRKL